MTTSDADVRFAEFADTINRLELDNEVLRESILGSTQFWTSWDNAGWQSLTGYSDDIGPNQAVLREWAANNRQTMALNPLLKRASKIRTSYIFGEGVLFGTNGRVTGARKDFMDANADTVFSQQAWEELEQCLNTDGQVFLLLDRRTRTVQRIPIREIGEVVVTPGNSERRLFYQRVWAENAGNLLSGTPTMRTAWYPVADLRPREWHPAVLPNIGTQAIQATQATQTSTDQQSPVDYTKAILHIAVNRQSGWAWGVPDLMPVIFWTRAYKEFLEANFTLIKALAQFAWKVTSPSTAATKRTAAKLAATPAQNSYTGEYQTAGATALMRSDENLVALNKAGATVNLDAGRPLAAMVAAGMEVSVVHLLSDPSVGNYSSAATLDIPTTKAMIARQSVYKQAFERIFKFFGLNIKVRFPPIQSDALYRLIQAVTTAASTNALHPEEIRQMVLMVLRSLGLEALPGLPDPGSYSKFVGGKVNQNPGTSPANTPNFTQNPANPAQRSPAGPMADGNHDNRANLRNNKTGK